MSKVSMIFKIKLTIEKAKNEISVWKKSCDQTRDRSPIPHFFIINGSSNDGPCKRMGNTVHKFMVTWKSPCRQIGNVLMVG